jgi:hypothetical protein
MIENQFNALVAVLFHFHSTVPFAKEDSLSNLELPYF